MIPTINAVLTGKRIRHVMKMRKLTVNDVRERMALESVQAVYHWLEGKCLPTLDNLYTLSRLLNVPMDALVVGEPDYQRCLCRVCLLDSSRDYVKKRNRRKRPRFLDFYVIVEGKCSFIVERVVRAA